MHKGLTRLFAQHAVRVVIENVGSVSAEGLSLEIRSGNTVLHAIPYWVLLWGRPAPEPRPFYVPIPNYPRGVFASPHREPFTFHWDARGPDDHLILSCASFRQGKIYTVYLTIELLATSLPKAHIEAVVTCSNMKGEVRKQLIIGVDLLQIAFDEAYDPLAGLKINPPFTPAEDAEDDAITLYRNNGLEVETD